MDDRAHLVNEAAAQVAAWEVRAGFVRDQVAKYKGDPLPEELEQRWQHVQHQLELMRATYRKLKSKADLDRAVELGEARIDGSLY